MKIINNILTKIKNIKLIKTITIIIFIILDIISAKKYELIISYFCPGLLIGVEVALFFSEKILDEVSNLKKDFYLY